MTDRALASEHAGSRRHRVAEFIAEARRDAGLTQRGLASEIGTRPYVVDELESGRMDPCRYASRIEAATRKPPGWLSSVSQTSGEATSAPLTDDPSIVLSADERLGRNLVLGVLAVILTIRFFTNQIPIIPGAGNFIDVLLLPVLLLAVASQSRPETRSKSLPLALFAVPGGLFLAVCVLSGAINVSRVAPGPALLFVYGFLGPLVFLFAAYRLWPGGQALAMSRLIVVLGVLQFVVIALFDLPTFIASGNPDDIAGTFGGNAYQLVFFLLVFAALVAGIATFEAHRAIAKLAPIVFGLTFLVVFLAQYRALLVSTVLAIVLVGFLLGWSRGRGFLVGAFALTAFVAGFAYVATEYPGLKFSQTVEAVRDDPASFLTARLEPGRDVVSLYGDNARFVVTGTGPGTYSSRAWRTFAEVGSSASAEGAAQPYASAVTGGQAYRTDVAEKYVVPRLENAAVVLGSRAVTSPYSSYLALLAEVGVVGFALMLLIYLRALLLSGRMTLESMRSAPPRDPLPAIALATTVAFFLLIQMAFLENWWEVARVTIPSWILLGVCIREAETRAERLGRR